MDGLSFLAIIVIFVPPYYMIYSCLVWARNKFEAYEQMAGSRATDAQVDYLDNFLKNWQNNTIVAAGLESISENWPRLAAIGRIY